MTGDTWSASEEVTRTVNTETGTDTWSQTDTRSATASRSISPTLPANQSMLAATDDNFVERREVWIDSNRIRYPENSPPQLTIVISGFTQGLKRSRGRLLPCLLMVPVASSSQVGVVAHRWSEFLGDEALLALDDDIRGVPAKLHVRLPHLRGFLLDQPETVELRVNQSSCLIVPQRMDVGSVLVTFGPTSFHSSIPFHVAFTTLTLASAVLGVSGAVAMWSPSLLLLPARTVALAIAQQGCFPLRHGHNDSQLLWSAAFHPSFVTNFFPSLPGVGGAGSATSLLLHTIVMNCILVVAALLLSFGAATIAQLRMRRRLQCEERAPCADAERGEVPSHSEVDPTRLWIEAQAAVHHPGMALWCVLFLLGGTLFSATRLLVVHSQLRSSSSSMSVTAFVALASICAACVLVHLGVICVIAVAVAAPFTPEWDSVDDVDQDSIAWLLRLRDEQDERGVWVDGFLCDRRVCARFGAVFLEFRQGAAGAMVVEIFLTVSWCCTLAFYDYRSTEALHGVGALSCETISLIQFGLASLHLFLQALLLPYRCRSTQRAVAVWSGLLACASALTCAYEQTLLAPIAATGQLVALTTLIPLSLPLFQGLRNFFHQKQRRAALLRRQRLRLSRGSHVFAGAARLMEWSDEFDALDPEAEPPAQPKMDQEDAVSPVTLATPPPLDRTGRGAHSTIASSSVDSSPSGSSTMESSAASVSLLSLISGDHVPPPPSRPRRTQQALENSDDVASSTSSCVPLAEVEAMQRGRMMAVPTTRVHNPLTGELEQVVRAPWDGPRPLPIARKQSRATASSPLPMRDVFAGPGHPVRPSTNHHHLLSSGWYWFDQLAASLLPAPGMADSPESDSLGVELGEPLAILQTPVVDNSYGSAFFEEVHEL